MIVVPQPSTRLMRASETATVGDVIVMPSVTNEAGGPVGELVMVEAVLLHRSPFAPVVTGQYMTLAVCAWIMQLLHSEPRALVEYEGGGAEGVIVHRGPPPVAKPS